MIGVQSKIGAEVEFTSPEKEHYFGYLSLYIGGELISDPREHISLFAFANGLRRSLSDCGNREPVLDFEDLTWAQIWERLNISQYGNPIDMDLPNPWGGKRVWKANRYLAFAYLEECFRDLTMFLVEEKKLNRETLIWNSWTGSVDDVVARSFEYGTYRKFVNDFLRYVAMENVDPEPGADSVDG